MTGAPHGLVSSANADPTLAATPARHALQQRGWRSGQLVDRVFRGVAMLAVLLPMLVLAALLYDVIHDGAGRLSWAFLTGYPSRHADQAGLLPALAGSAWLLFLTAAFAVPVGVSSALFLEEYGPHKRLGKIIELNIHTLAGVPSILYGLLGLEIFVRLMGLGKSVLAGGATLALLVLPMLVVATREALRTVHPSIREAGYALGATRWQVLRQLVLPNALPGLLTGIILALSRAAGETAPLVVIGALTFVTFLPTGPTSPFAALPIQIFNWVSRPQEAFAENAAAGILVLLTLLLSVNTVAVLMRDRFRGRGAQ